MLTHQKIVRDYINLYTPYRGLLLYHGLGSGKTCSSIGIAEGLKTDKEIIIMTPASLMVNYIEELKKCGDKLYRKNQFWEFINTEIYPELVDALSYALSLSTKFINDNGGVWLVNIKEKSNFDELTTSEKQTLDAQLNKMIQHKYRFIRYNGLRKKWLDQFTKEDKETGEKITINPFSNKVIIIDEAHNFVSRIVNKLKRPGSLSLILYDFLMSAENTKIILLTGTPIINYPNEIAIAMNILRGYIETWTFKLSITDGAKITEDSLIKLFKSNLKSNNLFDYLQYNVRGNILLLTRNPYGFASHGELGTKYKGVKLGPDGSVDNITFKNKIIEVLNDNNITVLNDPDSIKETCLPDTLAEFSVNFIKTESEKKITEKNDDYSNLKNMNKFKRRILGLISYFPDIDALLPKYEKSKDFHIVEIPMSDFQFSVYEEARVQERKTEKKRPKAGGSNVYEESSSTYRVFSRAFCNFVFPRPDIKRPFPKEGEDISSFVASGNEDTLDALSLDEKKANIDGNYDEDDIQNKEDTISDVNINYKQRMQLAVQQLEANSDKYLTPEALKTYSPKFLNILENVHDPEYIGLHLIYSQFRTLEGIGILSLILKANGFAQFKLSKDVEWNIDIPLEDRDKPKFVLYTGTETAEEKEIIRNIFNSNWDAIKDRNLKKQLEEMHENNFYGKIIKVIMITASGAEGISLQNVRYVHITEPYWHPVRTEQIIGRARRICSHKNLPNELQTVKVYLYLMSFTKEQRSDKRSIELQKKDKSKLEPFAPVTSDQALFEAANIKETINKDILHNIKEASIDCNIHSRFKGKEKLQCFTFGPVNSDKFAYLPSIFPEDSDKSANNNKTKEKVKAVVINIPKIGKCAYNKINTEVYDLDSYKKGDPVVIGHISIDEDGTHFNPINI